ncbi:uncharacterized protein ASCRUDRAFT_8751 [Ascoidea rubescens DSM 1968]|uniref:Uncharacterized protein n=1 Tax=Ascoidea rubescens DSM 1968 TaxID=1344418 RepID=A0A1D2VG84_9ASCO|nr:hypothetical protein ASCRUDRAFT_8751 [Ascoidea rubescens DSM 1968]ODV60550.1 hypothetical protein ASCRUDRAFT_8751 [Ascoidea rubescens DSM 1968]
MQQQQRRFKDFHSSRMDKNNESSQYLTTEKHFQQSSLGSNEEEKSGVVDNKVVLKQSVESTDDADHVFDASTGVGYDMNQLAENKNIPQFHFYKNEKELKWLQII